MRNRTIAMGRAAKVRPAIGVAIRDTIRVAVVAPSWRRRGAHNLGGGTCS
jgi:hypothetical protein